MKNVLPIAFVLLASLVSAQDGKVSLAPKEGDARKYKFTMNFTVGGMEVVLKSDATQDVKKVADGKIEEVLTYRNFSVVLAGSPMEGMEPEPVSTTVSSAGQLLRIGGGLAGTDVARLHLLGVFVPPAKALAADETETIEFKGSDDKTIPKVKYEITFLGKEAVNGAERLKFRIKYSEDPADGMRFTGTYWVTETGALVKAEGTFEEMFIPQAGATGSGRYLIESVG